MFKVLHILGLTAFILVGVACGASEEEVDQLIRQRVPELLSLLPTPTPIVFPTPLPTPTPVTFPTPLPTPTPIVFPTPLPTPTPVTFPTPLPTPTPVTFPPTPTPQLVLTPGAATPSSADFNSVYRRVSGSVFLIESSRGTGSGWALEPDLILTNQHVVAGVTTVTVRQATNPPLSATVLAVDRVRDIALLRLDTTRLQPSQLLKPLSIGQISTNDIARPLLALGYSGSGVRPDGTVGSPAANVGVLSQVIDFGSGSYGLNLNMDAAVDPGDSGGPVFNADGLVVGMVRAVMEQTAGGQRVVGTFYAVHVDEIRAALPALKAGQSR